MERHHSLKAIHPGELLREDIIPALNITHIKFAQALGTSRNTLQAILREERAVTPNMAARLGKVCGNGPGLWLRLQTAYDLENMDVDVSELQVLRYG
jgi:addiction module HigA family antidote